MLGRNQLMPFHAPCPGGGIVSLEPYSPERSMHAVVENGVLQGFSVTLHADAHVNQMSGCRVRWSQPADVQALLQNAAQVVGEQALTSIREAQKLHADVFGFGDSLRAHHPVLWRSLAQSWNDQGFPKLHVALHVSLQPDNSGLVDGSLSSETEPIP